MIKVKIEYDQPEECMRAMEESKRLSALGYAVKIVPSKYFPVKREEVDRE